MIEATDKIWSISQKSQTSEKEVLVEILKECEKNDKWAYDEGIRKIEGLRNAYNKLFNK